MSFKRWLSVSGTSNSGKEPLAPPVPPSTTATAVNGSRTPSNGSKEIHEVVKPQTLTLDDHDDRKSEEGLVFPNASPELPFGDGSNKVFGMENFGNTCYCNSILQCLYYTDEFRVEILKSPTRKEGKRERKRIVPGKNPHYSTAEPAVAISSNDESKEPPREKINLARRTSNFFGRKRNVTAEEETDTESSNTTDNTPTNNSQAPPPPAPTKNANLISITIPNIRNANFKILIGKVDPNNPTIDGRKKQALVEGPVLNIDHSLVDYGMKESLFTALKDVFEVMTETDAKMGVVSPSHLIITLKRENELFRSTMHQDAHEFFNFLLNDVIDTINAHLQVRKNGFHDIFEGFLTNQTKCLTCENVTSRDETFFDLSVDLRDNESIETCLKQFSASEMLTGSNKFYCDCCHSLQEAEKCMGIRKLPKILSLHLKRFKYNEEMKRNVKLFHKIIYPLYLKLKTDIASGKPDDDLKFYQLYGVVVHIGGGPHHGHYVALVKTKEQGWLLFDDETVEKIDEDFVLSFVGGENEMATAYVLFYQQITQRAYELGIIAEQLRASRIEDDTTPSSVVTPSNTATQPSQVQTKTSEPFLNPKFSFDSGSNIRPGDPDQPTSTDVSPLEKLTKVNSIGQSLNSSQKSTTSSEEKLKESKSSMTRLSSMARFKSKPATLVSQQTPSPQASKVDSTLPTSAAPVKNSRPNVGSNPVAPHSDEKQKKKRMSMSFNFKRS